MSRRLILLVGLSLAAIFLASLILLQGRSDFVRPLFPNPWRSSEGADSAENNSWLEHIDGLIHGGDSPAHDPHDKPPSSALADEPTEKEESKPSKPSKSPSGTSASVASPSKTSSSAATSPSDAGTDQEDEDIDTAIIESGGFHDEVIDISMVEVGGSHDEVIGALIHAFGAQPGTHVQTYQKQQRWGSANIFNQFKLANPLPKFKHKSEFKSENWKGKEPNILVSTTCEIDSLQLQKQYEYLLEKGNTYLFCVIHHADRWRLKDSCTQKLLPWVKAGMVDFVALSKHTQNYLDAELQKWLPETGGIKPRTRHMVPVFPVDLSNTPEAKQTTTELAFALQGDYSSGRRDYNKIFNHLSNFLNSSPDTDLDVQLHLIGHGQHPEVPEDLASHVNFDESLQYLQFYGILHRQFALLPAFASETYYDRKASSSVPASLIAGVPIVATQQLLDAYTYLPHDAVWFQGADEEDFDVIGRVIKMSKEERRAKKAKVQEANEKRIEMNKGLAGEWVREAMAKVRENKAKKESKTAEDQADGAPEGVGNPEVLGSDKLNNETSQSTEESSSSAASKAHTQKTSNRRRSWTLWRD